MPGTLKQYTEKNNKHLSFYIVVVENEAQIIQKEKKEGNYTKGRERKNL